MIKGHTLKNRQGVDIALNQHVVDGAKELAFLVHGLGGFKEQAYLVAMAEGLTGQGYTVIIHDAANTIGESGGKVEEATITGYYQDLEDVIAWAAGQDFYKEPFVLAGHSIGSACTILYAANYPAKVKGLAPVSAFIGGKYFARGKDEELRVWQERGYKESESNSKPGVMKRIKWGFVEDSNKYDIVLEAQKVTSPVLLAVGSLDMGTPKEFQELVQGAVQGPCDLQVIEGMYHTPRSNNDIDTLRNIVGRWAGKL